MKEPMRTTVGMIGGFDKQRFKQFNPEDTANWYLTYSKNGKNEVVAYPISGRRHISYLGQNRLVFTAEPRGLFTGLEYSYVVVNNAIYRVDQYFNTIEITGGQLETNNGDVYFARLVASQQGQATVTFACFVDGQKLYVYQEQTNVFSVVTDGNLPDNPTRIAAFGDRIVVSVSGSSAFYLSKIGLGGNSFNASTCFTPSVFASETDVIEQFAVLHNVLYIFTSYNTGIWANIPSQFTNVNGVAFTFPWKKNTSQSWDYGIAAPLTLDVDFDRLVFLGRNRKGLIQVLVSQGGQPKDVSTNAINLLFNRNNLNDVDSPFLNRRTSGFLYQEDNNIFYRLSTGEYQDFKAVDIETSSWSVEYNFEVDEWHRCIENNGERNRVQLHTYFADRHLVTVIGEGTVYQMSGQFYENELRNDEGVYTKYPFRYERVTPVLAMPDYSECMTEYLEIDFVFGDGYTFSDNPFEDTTFIITEGEPEYLIAEQPDGDGNPVYLIDEEPDAEGEDVYLVSEDQIYDPTNPTYVIDEEPDAYGNPVYLITEDSNIPRIDEATYNQLYKPHIELYFSNDGGVTWMPADVREFSQLGVYQWRMRWYQLDCWRNRSYKLVCVSGRPIVVMGEYHKFKRVSGGAN